MRKLIINKKGKTHFIPIGDLVCIINDRRLAMVYFKRGESIRMIKTYASFKDILPQLDERFLKCTRSYIINMEEVESMEECKIDMGKGLIIYLGINTFGRVRRQVVDYNSKKCTADF